jgi:hypothetical protein
MRQRLKPHIFRTRYGTAEAVPYKDLETAKQAGFRIVQVGKPAPLGPGHIVTC